MALRPGVGFGLAASSMTEVDYARARVPDRTYISRAFELDFRASQDHGQPARFVSKVFDESPVPEQRSDESEIEWTEEVVYTTPGGRKQIKVQVAREAGRVREIEIQRVPTDGAADRMEKLLTLDRDASQKLIEFVRNLQYVTVDGDEQTVRFDDELAREFFLDPQNVMNAYRRSPDGFRQAIAEDPGAADVVAIARRRTVVGRFRRLLEDAEYFEAERAGRGREAVWQALLEENPWILGVSLAGQLLTSWDEEKLEKVVAGFSVAGAGKRADALLRTSGSIRSLVIAEIKHHETDLLAGTAYRPDCWSPSGELAGAVTQVQQTVEAAVRRIGERLPDKDADGAETGDNTYLFRPRSFLIVGHLGQLRGQAGGVHVPKQRSFELFRRNLYEPEIITFDELLARAEWNVDLAEREQRD